MEYTVPHYIPSFGQFLREIGHFNHLILILGLSFFSSLIIFILAVTLKTLDILIFTGFPFVEIIILGTIIGILITESYLYFGHTRRLKRVYSYSNVFSNGKYYYKQAWPYKDEGIISFEGIKDISFSQGNLGKKYNYGFLDITVHSASARNSFSFQVIDPQKQYDELSPLVVNKT